MNLNVVINGITYVIQDVLEIVKVKLLGITHVQTNMLNNKGQIKTSKRKVPESPNKTMKHGRVNNFH